MNEWDKRIREHRVWSEMQSLGPAIDVALTVLPTMSPQELAGLERLKAVLAYGGKRLAAADPLITTPGPLDQIANALGATRNELDAFTSDKDPSHLIGANIAADGALPFFYSLPGAYSPEELGALVSVATGYRNMVEQAISSDKAKLEQVDATATATLADFSAKAGKRFAEFTDSSESLQAKLTDLATGLQGEQQKLTQIVSDQQGQFSTAQEARSKEFTEGLRLATQEINRLTTEYQSQFSTGQDARSKEFVDAQTLRQNGYAEILKDYAKRLSDQDTEFTKQRTDFVQVSKDELDRLTSEYEEKAKAVLDLVQERQRDVEKVVGVIGNLGVTSGYLRAANQAQKGMWGWQAMTMVAMGFLSWAAYKTLGLLENSEGQFNWGGFAGRVLLLGSLAAIAAYSGFQADKLFVDEKRNRKLALELEAIGPYLAPLPEDDQNKFRILIGEKSFGRDHEMDLHQHKSPVSILHLLKSKPVKDLLEVLAELAKKGKIPE
jgi:hypothetical protein